MQISYLVRAGVMSTCGIMCLGPTHAGIIRVPEHYATIQQAIEASSDGDDIVVAPGLYRESINFNRRAVRVRGQEGGGTTVIDGDGTYQYVVHFPAGTRGARLENVTVTGAAGMTDQQLIDYGGAIFVDRAYDIVLRDITVTGNAGYLGAGVFCKGGSAVIENSTIWDNVGAYGGGLGVQSSTVTVRWSRIEQNGANIAGGGIWVSGGRLAMEDCYVGENAVTGIGAGVAAEMCELELTRCRIALNGRNTECPSDCFYDAERGGGLHLDALTGGSITDCRIDSNAANAGAGLYLTGHTELAIVNSSVSDNSAGTLGGAGMYVEMSSPQVVNCSLVGNLPGGVRTTVGSSPAITNCILSENQAPPITNTEIYGLGSAYVSYSLINGNVINGAQIGPGVVYGLPRLDGALRPKAGSPVIDAGNNGALPESVVSDLGGMSRYIDDPETANTGVGAGTVVDMGAMEYSVGALCAADFDGDGFVNGEDHTRFVYAFERGSERADFDGDGFVNGADFDMFNWAFLEGC